MSHLFIKAACASAGLVLALAAAGTAHAGKPLTIKQKNDLARAMARPNAAKTIAPRATAKSAVMVAPGGSESAVVPEELDHYLTAQPDANGRMRVRDTDANATPAAAVEATNEK